MRAYDQGAYFRVTVSESEVEEFRRSWPCSGLPHHRIAFTFDKRNGDLVDTYPAYIDGGAVVALAQDAQDFGEWRLGLLCHHGVRASVPCGDCVAESK